VLLWDAEGSKKKFGLSRLQRAGNRLGMDPIRVKKFSRLLFKESGPFAVWSLVAQEIDLSSH